MIPSGYKQTEAGVIPEDWKSVLLGDVIQLQRGFDLPHRLRQPGTVQIISSSGASGTHNRALISAPGVVTGRYGTIGEVFYVEEDFWPLNTTLFVKDFKGNNPFYISLILKTIDFAMHSGKSGVPGVNRNDLHEIIVAIPSPNEQQAIAAALGEMDALLAAQRARLAKQRAVKQGLLQGLLSGKQRLPGFAGEWKEKLLREVLRSTRLGGNYSNNEVYSGYPLIKMGNMARGYIKLDKIEYINDTKSIDKNHRLKYGDLLFNTRNTPELVGKISIWRDELPLAYYNSNILRLEFDPTQIGSNFFVNYVMNTDEAIARMRGLATGTTSVAAIYTRDLLSFTISIPPLDEQRAIAAVLSEADAYLAALEAEHAKTQLLKQGMMQNLLTGKLRLV